MTKSGRYFLCCLCFLIISCANESHRTLQYVYSNGEVCRQSYDSNSELVRCECKTGPSTNYTKYSPNFYRTPRPSRPGVDGYCLTPDEYSAIYKIK